MASISCTEFNERLAEAVESRQTVDSADLRAHAEACAKCRLAWLDAMLVDSALAGWKEPLAAVDLADAILFRIAAQVEPPQTVEAGRSMPASAAGRLAAAEGTIAAPVGRRTRLGRRSAAVATLAVAVALAVAVFVGRMTPGQKKTTDAPSQPVANVAPSGTDSSVHVTTPKQLLATNSAPSAARTDSRPQARIKEPTVLLPGNPPVESLVRDAGTAYLQLAGDAAKAVAGAAVLVPSAEGFEGSKPANVADDRWMNEVERGFEPVTRQLGQAFGFLIQAVPAERVPAT